MIINDNQIRHVYNAVDENGSSTFTAVTKNGKFYGIVKLDNRFPDDDNEFRTDIIERNQIRSVVVSNPEPKTKMKTWTIAFNASTPTPAGYAADKIIRVTFDFINWYGIGTDHFYHKFVEFKATGTPADDADTLKELIDKTFKYEACNPFKTNSTSGSLVITEKKQYSNVLMGIDNTGIDCDINVVIEDDRTNIAAVPDASAVNGPELNELVYAAHKNRADLYGYANGTWYANPSEVRQLDTTKSYIVIDIVYVKQGSGTDIQEQRKEMTIIVDPNDWSKVTKIIRYLFGGVDDWSGRLYTSNGVQDATIGTSQTSISSSISKGQYWIANL